MAQRARPVVGIRDVAAAAGVSVTTVSHALNGKGRLPPETRERVRGVADRLGYRPNPAARGLAGGRTGLLGLVVSQAAGLPVVLSDFAYFGQLMAGATSAAIERDHAVVLAPPDHDIAGLQLDGAIVVDPVAHDPVVARLRETGRPVVTTGRVLGEDAGAPWVDNDHAAGTLGMLEHLRRHGARTVALVAGPPVHSYDEDVESAYRAWCARHGVPAQVGYVEGELTEGAAYATVTRLLEEPERPDAVYASLDRLGLGALLAADALGVRVPEDLLVAACTDSEAAKAARPPLTALNLNPDAIGRHAVELLLDLVEGAEPAERHVIVPTRIVPRASTGAARRAPVAR